jgi:pyruvate/2-oxoglutarate dehydrogenase complex dihydrolipoamide dehydrogenase (E3) component
MYDVVVIGGGPAGVTAALRARELGASVALVERGQMGGTCTNDGCVPTRVLARAARLIRDSRQFADYGLFINEPPEVDFVHVLKRAQQVVYQIHEKKQLIEHLHEVQAAVFAGVGDARFIDPHRLQLGDGQTLEAERFIICAGGSPRRLPFPGAEFALTHSDVWRMNSLPASVVIVGGGATGCQLASVFAAFGAKVMLMDVAPRILLSEDAQVADAIVRAFNRHEIDIITSIEKVERIEEADREYRLIYRKDGEERALDTGAVVLSVGWPGNVEALNLPAAEVEVERNYIKVNDYLQTSAGHIYAAGDITGRMMLVQSASSQARVAAENALLKDKRPSSHRLVPHGGFTDPEYGGVGLTEEQARGRNDIAVAVVPYADLDRAVIDGHTEGFCKLIVERETGQIIGAHVVGEQALEVVQMVASGIAGGLNVQQLAELELAYPTFAAIVGLAARQLVRELGAVRVAPEWQALKQLRGAEWERKEEF